MVGGACCNKDGACNGVDCSGRDPGGGGGLGGVACFGDPLGYMYTSSC